ncbi:MAG: hypothetical protein J6P37_04535 [Lachnospiraceae bacterium]|nr:hypothetical protein [Lachnospiraceae bacterium]
MTNEFFKSFKGILIVIVLTVMEAGIIWFYFSNHISLKKDPINISDVSLDWSSLKAGDHVVGDIQFSPGYFMYIERNSGYVESRDYVITDYAKWEGEYSYYYMMAVRVNNGGFESWDKLAYPSEGKSVHIEGVLKKLNSQQRSYLDRTLREAGFSNEEINSAVIPLMVFQVDKDDNVGLLIIMIAVGVIVIGLWFLVIKAFRTKEDYSDDYLSRDDAISRYYGNNSANDADTGYSGSPYSYYEKQEAQNAENGGAQQTNPQWDGTGYGNTTSDNEAFNQFSGYTSGKTLSAPSEQESGGEEQPKFWVKK